MKNVKLLQLLESVLGKGKSTSGNNIAFFSPFVSHYKPKLEIDIETNSNGENPWHCWISDKKGRSIASLFKQLNLPKERFEQLQKVLDSAKYKSFHSVKERTVTLQLPTEYKPLWIQKTTPDFKNAIHYLKMRGITLFDIIKYRIGYSESGEYAGKIIIPSYDSEGQLNYFVSRAFYKADSQKHKNPKVSKDIIGFDLTINWSQPIVLCEGAFDAIAVKRNAIPMLGKFLLNKLKNKIRERGVKEINIMLDSDAISDSTKHADYFIKNGIKVKNIIPSDKDAGELGFIKVNDLIKKQTETGWDDLILTKIKNL